ncbi:Dynamin-related protein 4C [Fulvia fulva]|uniref:Dynamin-related protein 4C n=1 Tax=Passalora fulva TaxID=5499 RepID=A0A9Q8PET3_PASFU|nr:Dynamin-related protein 4C [Fulvia fulva]KAK4618312.1 Dynamin-related protein 4C [Fulvia fulva]KAK4619128.1 Dynamin-related protein 4C [Fulvia fulva]UJO21269.1 Dynamin-related protein 4C [Fulvia fulva]WPV18689.1 Dynamin-related protein 4C [Fulvia fulva]WPV32909.1 Dynamin-related protein 4C [Fulvia fulva]
MQQYFNAKTQPNSLAFACGLSDTHTNTALPKKRSNQFPIIPATAMTMTEELDVVPALPAKTISKALSAGTPEPSNVSVGIDTLQCSRQRKVLDTVDKLRTCGLGSEISLPQLVVCGDQSAGKSSVLEALTEITFPRADELCTRFATEIVLRRAASEAIAIKIIPDTLRSSNEQHAIKAFNEYITNFNSLTT